MTEDRLAELNVQTTGNITSINKGYTRFVKFMRLGLPLVAVILTVVVITWPEMDDKIVIIPKEDLVPQSSNDIGANELLNPHFETTDAQQNPVSVTAIRAVQSQDNPNLIKLDQPKADLKMKNGSAVHLEADKGTYEQEVEKLFLQDNVIISHESGYELYAEELRINLTTRQAFSDKNVRVIGSEAQVKATGLEANMEDGILIFKGPATLTLTPKTTNNTPPTTPVSLELEEIIQ